MNKIIALFVASASAVQLESIPAGSLMQNNPSHWRKLWPEGAVDNADGDAEILDRFNQPPKKKDAGGKETYPWTHSDEVKETQASIKKAEEITKETFNDAAATSRGLDMLHTYDNTGRVMEQDLPYGATLQDFNPNMHYYGKSA